MAIPSGSIKTGEKAGIIGLGCEHLDGKPYEQVKDTIQTALDCGINYLDVFMPGREIREHIARALGNRRGDVMIQGHIGSTDINQQYDISRDMPTVKKYFEHCLRTFGYIDFGMLFFIDTPEEFDKVFHGGLADYAQRLKQQGDIRHIGFSSHSPETAAQVVETGIVDIMMFSINLGFDLYPAEFDALNTLEDGWHTDDFTGHCVYCNHCLPCPKGINIAMVNKYLDIAKVDLEHVPLSIQSHYDSLTSHSGDCIGCGSCEKRCPFGVPVIENMKESQRIFGV